MYDVDFSLNQCNDGNDEFHSITFVNLSLGNIPNVAFINPPRVCPTLIAISSVAKLSNYIRRPLKTVIPLLAVRWRESS